jgi:hypothetical protein
MIQVLEQLWAFMTAFLRGSTYFASAYERVGHVVDARAAVLESEHVAEAKIMRAEMEAKYSQVLQKLENKTE